MNFTDMLLVHGIKRFLYKYYNILQKLWNSRLAKTLTQPSTPFRPPTKIYKNFDVFP